MTIEYTTQADLVLSVTEVAARLKTSTKTVYALIASGQLRAKRLGKQRVVRIPVRALEDYLNRDD